MHRPPLSAMNITHLSASHMRRLVQAVWIPRPTPSSLLPRNRLLQVRQAPASHSLSTMKRKAPSSSSSARAPKKPREKEPDYHATPSLRDDDGEIIWPAPKDQMQRARDIILEW